MSSIDIRYSRDGGNNWSDWRKLDMGNVGDFVKRVQIRRLGRGRQWVFAFRITDPAKADILAASIMTQATDS